MPAISAIAGVDSRIAAIRARIGAPALAGSGASSSVEIGGPSDPTEGFDPFGAVYQLALQNAGVPAGSPSGGSSPGAASATETYTGRTSSSGGALRVSAAGGFAGATTPATTSANGALAGQQVAQLAYNAGFRGQDLVNVVAISKRESNWQPSAFNGNASTGDLSFGLMQINMKGNLGPARLGQLGLSSNEQLLDPQTNMNAAFKIYSDSGNSLHAWGGYKGKSDTFDTDIAAAQTIVTDANLGNGF